jgi:class 3 adenylate cyclase/tetratricopeptide (TPR) repeat protein
VSCAPADGERRKVVTVIFADVVGSTALGERVDPETLRWAMQRWFGRMAEVIERHGGTVENYVGDAVMAVFGIPMAHEDDALRAVRAAAEMRGEIAILRAELQDERGVELAVRIGVNTGEAVTGAAATGGSFTAGDMVNVGARLEQAARPGDILLGHHTFRLVRHAVDVEPVAPLTVKGKADALDAFRLLAVAPDAHGRPRRARAPMVGRQPERQQVLEVFGRAAADRSCQLLLVLGAAGVGKSRLVADVVETLQADATVAVGRCLPYGDGLTWWPLVEALGASGLIGEVAAADVPAVRLAAELLKPDGEPIAPDEAFWAVRTVLETLARRRPLVFVIDDLQWADPTFMDLVLHIAQWTRDAPLLLLVMARPELLDTHPGWATSEPNAERIVLEPLAAGEAADLLRHLLGPSRLTSDAATRILDVAEGNPLFVEEVVAMLVDDGVLSADGEQAPVELGSIAVPPTIQALLAARLDRLTPPERAVMEAAAIEGKEFSSERVRGLVMEQDREAIAAELLALAGKDLIRRIGLDDDTYRFRHQLIRDAAYEGMPKGLRAVLHERFADRLEDHPSGIPGLDELLGYHLERAVVLRRELGAAPTATADIAARAASRLSAAGQRAAQRGEPATAAALLQRAIGLVDFDDAARGALLPALGAYLFEAGRMGEAIEVLDQAIARAPEPWLECRARIEREFVRLEAETSVGTERARRVVDEVLPTLERAGDDRGRCRAWSLRAEAAWITGQVSRADAAWGKAAECAGRAGDERELLGILGWRATAAVFGPTPVAEAIGRCDRLRHRVGASPVADAWAVNALALLHAMQGEFELADRLVAEANETLRQLGSLRANVSHIEALVRMLAGRPSVAEELLRADVEALTSMSDRRMLATTTAMLAQAVYAQGRLEEAAELCGVAATNEAADDIVTQAIWRGVKAKTLACNGECEEAEALARQAVALIAPTDLLSDHGDAMLALAEVLRACLRTDEFERAARTGLSLYVKKGNVVAAAWAQSLLRQSTRGSADGIQR